MKQMFLSTGKEFKEIETFEPGAWIHLVNPSQEEAMKVAERFNIDIQDVYKRQVTNKASRPDWANLASNRSSLRCIMNYSFGILG